LFASLYTDRGSHYWHTPKAGGKVAKENPTQSGKAMARLGIEMVPAYSPEARGRSERMFRTHQGRVSATELAIAGIRDMTAANRYLDEVYRPAERDLRMPKLEQKVPERRHCSRNPKWGRSDFGCTKLGDGHSRRRPAFVLRPSRRALRSSLTLPRFPVLLRGAPQQRLQPTDGGLTGHPL